MAKVGGKGSRAKNKARRKGLRHSSKEANKARWAEYAGTPANIKKKRAKNKKGFNSNKHMHLISNCGNVGCSKCFSHNK